MTRFAKIHPVVLCGGSGTRLWPLSRAQFPKQFHRLAGDRSMLQETLGRAAAGHGFAAPVVVCDEAHRFIVADQARAVGVEPADIVLEPVGRNTAPAVAVAALLLGAADPDGSLLVLPADHAIASPAAFHAAVARAAAFGDRLMTFGIAPDRPETGYGYIRRGAALDAGAAFAVDRFVEKPDAATAAAYLESGDYYWNSGIFLFPIRILLAELERQVPDILAACRTALAGARPDLAFRRLDADAFRACPPNSIDYAVMEGAERAGVVPMDAGWSDVGSWTSLWEIADRDADDNALVGDALAVDSRRSYLRSDGPVLVGLGLHDLIVVATTDAVLVADRDRAQDVRGVVDRLRAAGRPEHAAHMLVHRPWGTFELIDSGDRFQVKRIVVTPGARLSRQLHYHRAEHWVVVSGTARVERADETFLLHENESTFIPPGTEHRLENPGLVPLHLIEVQSGTYLGEDDIVRLDDAYGR